MATLTMLYPRMSSLVHYLKTDSLPVDQNHNLLGLLKQRHPFPLSVQLYYQYLMEAVDNPHRKNQNLLTKSMKSKPHPVLLSLSSFHRQRPLHQQDLHVLHLNLEGLKLVHKDLEGLKLLPHKNLENPNLIKTPNKKQDLKIGKNLQTCDY